MREDQPSHHVSVNMVRGSGGAVGGASCAVSQCGDADLHWLKFIKCCCGFCFSLKQTAVLPDLWNDKQRPSSEVKQLAQEHVKDLARRVLEMQSMQRTLESLVRNCHGDQRAECPILDYLADR